MQTKRMEIGSYFETPDDSILLKKCNFLKESFANVEWTSSGRDSFIALAKNFKERKVLHIPEFYCPLTLDILAKFFDVKFYVDLPTESAPRFETINAKSGDLVLALDIFGMRSRETWRAFYESRSDLIFVEDHSHAPFSEWAAKSVSNFTMASLRKSFPLPSGGYVGGSDFVRVDGIKGGAHEADELRGQFLRSLYMRGIRVNQALFTDSFHAVEEHYNANTQLFEMGDFSRELLFFLDIEKMQNIRKSNFILLKEKLEPFGDAFDFINSNTDNLMSLFNPMLMLKSQSLRDSLRRDLLFRRIYAPVLWELDKSKVSAQAYDVSSRILDIPLDFRCSKEHVEYVAAALGRFVKNAK